MLLAGDIGGTKTLLGLFATGADRPEPVVLQEFVTLEYESLESIITSFLEARDVSARELRIATFGVAGAITEQVADLTNVPWRVDAAAIARGVGLERIYLLNDLQALAHAVPALRPAELVVLQEGTRVPGGNIAVIAAGTGLGEAMLLHVEGRLVPGPSEGGHADFAARTPRELALVAALTNIFGRVENEYVLSGPGLVNLYGFTHEAFGTEPYLTPSTFMPATLCAGVGPLDDPADLPARISGAALARSCPQCVEALEMFVAAYGAEAGNHALRTVATAGVYVGGGIAPRILDALRAGAFMDAFRAKAPMHELVSRMPVSVILNSDAGLLGAAVHASAALRGGA